MVHKTSLLSLFTFMALCPLSLSPVHAYVFYPENSNPGANSISLSYNAGQSQGTTLAVDVKVNSLSSATPALGAAFDLDFDPAVVTYTGFVSGDFFEKNDIPGNGPVVRLAALQQGSSGKLIIGVSQKHGDPGASGSGIILTLKFSVASGNQILQSMIVFSSMNLISPQGQFIAGLNWYKGLVAQPPLSITTTILPEATQGISLTSSLTAAGGFPPYSWGVTAGSLAAGLALNSATGVISGTPTTAGTVNFTVQVTDANAATAAKALSMTVYTAFSMTTTALSDGTVNLSYTQTLAASGGKTPYSWGVISGTLPAGLSLNNTTGVISGTPTVSGTSNFAVRATDANGVTTTGNLSVKVNLKLLIGTTSLPETTVGAAYSTTLQGTGGTAPYTWKITSGLPTGLSLITTTGEILGISSTAGNWQFTVTVQDANSASATKTLAILVNPAPNITTASVNNLYQGDLSTNVTFGVTGGVAPYTWNITSGGLPTGLTLNSQNGTVSGTPTKPGIYTFTLEVTDATGIKTSTTYIWSILATPPGNVDFATVGSENRVDGYDLIAMDIAFGTTKGSPGWNPLADLNGDGIINDADFTILQQNFGKSN